MNMQTQNNCLSATRNEDEIQKKETLQISNIEDHLQGVSQ